MTERTKYQSAQ